MGNCATCGGEIPDGTTFCGEHAFDAGSSTKGIPWGIPSDPPTGGGGGEQAPSDPPTGGGGGGQAPSDPPTGGGEGGE